MKSPKLRSELRSVRGRQRIDWNAHSRAIARAGIRTKIGKRKFDIIADFEREKSVLDWKVTGIADENHGGQESSQRTASPFGLDRRFQRQFPAVSGTLTGRGFCLSRSSDERIRDTSLLPFDTLGLKSHNFDTRSHSDPGFAWSRSLTNWSSAFLSKDKNSVSFIHSTIVEPSVFVRRNPVWKRKSGNLCTRRAQTSKKCNLKYKLSWPCINRNSVYCMRIRSRKTAKQTCRSRLGSLCGSRTETMQKTSWTHWKP